MDKAWALFQRGLDQRLCAAQRLIELLIPLLERVRFDQCDQSHCVNVQIAGRLATLHQMCVERFSHSFQVWFVGLSF